jgi:FdhE protein
MKAVSQMLSEAAQQNPDLAPYYEFHRALAELREETRGEITATLEMRDEEALEARLLQGLSLLSFAQLPVEADRFAQLVSRVAQVVKDYDPELVEQAVDESPAELLAVARQRFERTQGSGDQGDARDKPTFAEMAVDLALKPYLEWAAEQMMPFVDQERWKRSYCPICGSAPDFATLDKESGARHLLCPRCSSEWRYRRMGCPFCDNADHTQIVYYPSEDGVYRLYVCQECRHYLKTLDLRKTARAVLLSVERVATVAMDVAATEEGYRQ